MYKQIFYYLIPLFALLRLSLIHIFGSPPGYVGYDDAGQLTEKIRRKPYSVILLDEIEKAHPEVLNLFLQILDDGRVADSHGKIINFENTIIIMTTNAGSEFKSSSLGFNSSDEIKLSANIDTSLKQHFKPEFLNRIDEIVTFSPLTRTELRQIIDLMLRDITERIEERGARLCITDAAKEIILNEGYNVKYGARPLKRAIQRLIAVSYTHLQRLPLPLYNKATFFSYPHLKKFVHFILFEFLTNYSPFIFRHDGI